MNMKLVGIGVLTGAVGTIGAMVYFAGDHEQGALVDESIGSISGGDSLVFGHSLPLDLAESSGSEPQLSREGDRGSEGFGINSLAQRLMKYDFDGDGFLSDEERAEMRRARFERMLGQYDLDQDGKLSRKERRASFRDRLEQSDRGQRLMREFDLDQDGILSDEEQAAMDAYTREQRQIRRETRRAQYDIDNDGVLSPEERAAQREDLTREFDKDGDGQLNIEEQLDRINTTRERQAIDRFVDRYDADGDGAMGGGDYSAFLRDYSNASLRADVNGDGMINTLDMSAYTDMVTRSGNRP